MATFISQTPMPAEIEKGVALWKRKQLSSLIMFGVLLFLGAGTLNWPQGWLYLGLHALTIAAQMALVLPRSPALLAERSRLQAGTKRWDVVMSIIGLGFGSLALLLVAGLDYRNGWTAPLPLWVVALAVVAMIVGWAIIIWAMVSNPFFAATVRVQTDRDQRVITGGPYGYVRHPGYVGAILYNAATPFILGSLWALLPALVVVLFFIARTLGEDPVLQRELPGYRDYSERVRYRLLPGLW